MKNRSVIVEWIICYTIILMIPVITICANYLYNVEVIKQEIHNNNELVLNNLADSMNGILAEEREFFNHMLSYEEFKLLINKKEQDGWFDYYAKEVRLEAEDYNKWREMSCMIYMYDVDCVIGKQVYDSSIYYGSLEQFVRQQISYAQWRELLSSEYSNEFLSEKYLDGRTDKQCFLYADSFQWGRSGKINMFISVPVSKIEQLAEGINLGSIFVISTNSKVLLGVSAEGVVEIPEDMYTYGETGILFDDEDYMVINQKSSEENVTYFMLVPQRDFWKEFRYVRNLFFGQSVTYLVDGNGLCALSGQEKLSSFIEYIYQNYEWLETDK